MLVVLSGLPGTGKTTVADSLARSLGAVRVSVDPVEEAMLASGLPASWETGVAAYRVAAAVAGLNLSIGRTVVADAVNDSAAARATWTAGGADVRFVLLVLDDEAEHRRRIEQRPAVFDHVRTPSWAQVQQRAASYEPWQGDPLRVDAAAPVDHVVERVLRYLSAG